jgi:hypothetical protein
MKKHAFLIVSSIALAACSSSSTPPAPSEAPAAPPSGRAHAAAPNRPPVAAPQWGQDVTPEGRIEAAMKNFDRRFDIADTNHDGYLSRDEANASMPMMARNFDKIDADHDGRLSKDEIHAYLQGRFDARAAPNNGAAGAAPAQNQ